MFPKMVWLHFLRPHTSPAPKMLTLCPCLQSAQHTLPCQKPSACGTESSTAKYSGSNAIPPRAKHVYQSQRLHTHSSDFPCPVSLLQDRCAKNGVAPFPPSAHLTCTKNVNIASLSAVSSAHPPLSKPSTCGTESSTAKYSGSNAHDKQLC